MTNRVLAVAISGKLGCTFRWSHLGGRYLIWVMCIGDKSLGPWIGHNLNLSNEKNFPLRPRVVVHDVGTVVYVGSRERLV